MADPPKKTACDHAWEGISAKLPLLVTIAAWLRNTAAEFHSEGYSEHFGIFNVELLRPLKAPRRASTAPDAAPTQGATCDTVLDMFSLRPRAPKMAFIFWNVVCFWVGILDVVLVLVLEHGLSTFAILMGVFDGVLGYAFAYTFYFLFITTGIRTKLWMARGLGVILCYVLGTGFLTYSAWQRIEFIEEQTGETLNEVLLEIFLESAKCLANLFVLFHGVLLYAAQPNDANPDASMMV